jgi:hypothetical protein
MFILYTVAPLLYRLASSAYYNLVRARAPVRAVQPR